MSLPILSITSAGFPKLMGAPLPSAFSVYLLPVFGTI